MIISEISPISGPYNGFMVTLYGDYFGYDREIFCFFNSEIYAIANVISEQMLECSVPRFTSDVNTVELYSFPEVTNIKTDKNYQPKDAFCRIE